MSLPAVIVICATGGAIGAWLRVVVRDECVARGIPSWRAIVAINLFGSLVAGAFIQLEMWSMLWSFVVAGLLGGFTTFSSMCLDIVVQWQSGRKRDSVVILTSTMVCSPIVAAIGTIHHASSMSSMTASAAGAAPPPCANDRLRHHCAGLMLIAIGGGAGSALRIGTMLGCDRLAIAPWVATLIVNVIGSAIATFVFRSLMSLNRDGAPIYDHPRMVSTERLLILGFCGGLTTMSTLAVEIASAWALDAVHGLAIALTSVAAGLCAAILGWRIAALRFPAKT